MYGHTLNIAGEFKKAIAAFNRAVNRSPGIADSHSGLGCALIAAGKPGEAIVEFDKALSLNPKPPTCHIGNRAIALVGIGKPGEATTTMKDLISRYPSDQQFSLWTSLSHSLPRSAWERFPGRSASFVKVAINPGLSG